MINTGEIVLRCPIGGGVSRGGVIKVALDSVDERALTRVVEFMLDLADDYRGQHDDVVNLTAKGLFVKAEMERQRAEMHAEIQIDVD